jgi:hypothetical protein
MSSEEKEGADKRTRENKPEDKNINNYCLKKAANAETADAQIYQKTDVWVLADTCVFVTP